MNFQILLFQLLCVVLIASSAYGEPLPESIRLRYIDCYELKISDHEDTSTPQSSPHPPLDNICLDKNNTMYHFLSSAQGGTKSFIRAPIVNMTVTLFFKERLSFILSLPFEPQVVLRCIFRERRHLLTVYNRIYQFKPLTRQDFAIVRIQSLLVNPQRSDQLINRSELSRKTVLYTESFDDKLILTFKREGENGDVGDTALVLLPQKFNVSDALQNSNVVVNFVRTPALYFVLTFLNDEEANRFSHSFIRDHFSPDTLVSIPPGVHEFLDTVLSIFQE